ncbi:hypothetical protein CGRA01v4_02979 [Colletotrichum graminicola]|nr:hypothetical protein CGRA01v4_02979 [Colletotrichum graminicola]
MDAVQREKKVPAPNNFPNAFQYDGPFIGGSRGMVPAMWPPLGRGGWATGIDLSYSGYRLKSRNSWLASAMPTPITNRVRESLLILILSPRSTPEWRSPKHFVHGARLLHEEHSDRRAFRASSSATSLRPSRLLSHLTSCINFVPAASYHTQPGITWTISVNSRFPLFGRRLTALLLGQ